MKNSSADMKSTKLETTWVFTERIRPRYAEIGIWNYETGRQMSEMTNEEIMAVPV
jgi:hypothetical protein